MFLFLSKFLPQFIYPLSLSALLLFLALLIHRRKNWHRRILLLALIILWLGGNNYVSHQLVRSLEWRYLPETDIPSAEAIVLLGGGTLPQVYPRPTIELNGAGDRVIYAGRLYNRGKAPVILVSGENLPWTSSPTSPADEMRELLVMIGVPEEAILMESTSKNTYENALYSREMLQQKGIHRILLVTSAMHMPRSVMVFMEQGIDVIPAPTDFNVVYSEKESPENFLISLSVNILPSASNLELTTRALKEYIGIFVYKLRGWA